MKKISQIETETLKSQPGSHAPAWEPIRYAFPRWSAGTRGINKTCILGLGFFIHGKIRSQLPGGQLRTTMIANFPCHLKEVS